MIFVLNDALKVIAPSCIGLAAFILTLIAYTQYKEVRDTRNTTGLNKKFLIFQLYTCFFLGKGSLYGLCGGSFNFPWGPIDIVLILINVCLFCVNFYCLKIKMANIKGAEQAGVTEAEYYSSVIAPSLKLRVNH